MEWKKGGAMDAESSDDEDDDSEGD